MVRRHDESQDPNPPKVLWSQIARDFDTSVDE